MSILNPVGRSTPVRAGVAALAAAVLMSTAGCGSRATDAEIAAALRDPAAVADTGVAVDPSGAAPVANPQAPLDAAPAAAQGGPLSTPNAPGAAAGPSTTDSTGTSGTKTPTTGGQSAPVASGPATGTPVNVGTIGPFSGVIGAIASAAPKTLSAWAAYQNANGGLNGHPIRLIVGDDQGDPGTALTLVKRMVESDKIITLAGGFIIFGFEQIEQYMRQKNVPMMGGDGVVPGWYNTPVGFPIASHTPVQIEKGLRTFVDQGATKIAMLYCLELAAVCSYLYEQTAKSSVGKYIVQNYQVSLVAPSYTSQCLRMKQAGVEVMELLMDPAGASRVVQDCANQGFKPKIMLLGLDTTKDMPTIPALKEALVPGATFSPAAGQGVPAIENYRKQMAVYGASIGDSGVASFAWAAGVMLGLVGKNLSANPKPAELFDALWKLKNETLGGLIAPVTYPKGKPAVVAPCMFLWGVKDGKFTAPRGPKPIC
jgi:branched-chain amino acid transport system substrate-binding protein